MATTTPLALTPWRDGAGSPPATSVRPVPGLGTDLDATLDWVVRVGHDAPHAGLGETMGLWELLANAARLDVAAARILEPHLDALAILEQARAAGADVDGVRAAVEASMDSSWGVFAAEGHGTRVEASRDPEGNWRLEGTKPWCSLAGRLTHALVTAWVAPTVRALFAVRLRAEGVSARPGPWASRGLSQVVSAPIDFDAARAVPVGEPGWYLSRPGFAWGGMGVAAVWWGGSVPLRDALVRAAARDGADQLASFYAGNADAALWGARAVLCEAAHAVDAGLPDDVMATIAGRVRAVTAGAVECVLELADHALGPGPLTTDEDHARRVADLRIYVRQHHAERDLARVGRRLVP